ncbi:putative beta-lactamase-like 1 [Ornithorhynchus anatinus]|uniref:Lactamase beta like 1 n=1 Tax=Ornithorhynchus anatinus TaxID=9258 RepID=K7E9R7_ORNAN|nr:putative beta-lactamase-like 1 [Ornithorhynchus anatinus]
MDRSWADRGPRLLTVQGRWLPVASCGFFLLSIIMTGCFLWQYQIPKLEPSLSGKGATPATVRMCPRYPEPVPLDHPLPILRKALEKVDEVLCQASEAGPSPGHTAISAIVTYNDTVLWTGNFGKKNSSDPSSGPPNEYTVYRIASVSKLFPTLMLYRLWEEGKVRSLDDPLELYAQSFSIKNPLGDSRDPGPRVSADGLGFRPLQPSPVTLRRMASQLSGLPRRLRSTTLLWQGTTQDALALLRDDVLVADPGTSCHYSNVAFSLLAHVLADHAADGDFQRWVSEHVLGPLGMEDTGFDLTAPIRARMAAGFYAGGSPAPLYDLGWYRPSGQMFSTAADLAKLAMAFLGSSPRRRLLAPDTVKTMLTPLLECSGGYFAQQTGTPWEVNEQRGYRVVRKDGDLDGYAATFSLVPRLRLGLVVLQAGPRTPGEDPVTRAFDALIPAMETAFHEAGRHLEPPPSPAPYVGYYTFSNLTFYEILVGPGGVLHLRQFGPRLERLVPAPYRTLRLHHLAERVFQLAFDGTFPCSLPLDPAAGAVGAASLSLESQDRQLCNFYPFDHQGLSPGFDAPGLNTYQVLRLSRKPIFPA